MSVETSFAERRVIDAILFVDGVEIPFSSLEVTVGMDTPSVLRVAIRPDALVDQFRPKSWVHVFVRKLFPQENPDLQRAAERRSQQWDEETFFLYWEGELIGVQDQETADNRVVQLTAIDLWNIPGSAVLSMVDVGQGLKVPMLNGSTYFVDALGGGSLTQTLQQSLLSYLFGGGNSDISTTPAVRALQDTVIATTRATRTIGQLGQLVLRYLAPYNASYGLQLVRTRLAEKLVSLSDNMLRAFIAEKLARDVVGQNMNQAPASTVLDFLAQTIRPFFHQYTTILAPVPPDDQAVLPAVTPDTQSGQTRMYRSLAILPDLYYAVAPLCNWLFPDQYLSKNVDRQFMVEPTRLGLRSALTGALGLVHLAPAQLESILRGVGAQVVDGDTTTTRFMGARTGSELRIAAADNLETVLNTNGFFVGGVNLLNYLTPEEIEKGIVYMQDSNDQLQFLLAAVVNSRAQRAENQQDPRAVLDAYVRAAKQVDNPVAEPDSITDYQRYMRALAEYQLMFRRNSRDVQVTGVFNPWPIVGLPAIVAREGRSFRALLVGVTSRIQFAGDASTSYVFDYTQLLRPSLLSQELVSGFTAQTQQARAIQETLNALREQEVDVGDATAQALLAGPRAFFRSRENVMLLRYFEALNNDPAYSSWKSFMFALEEGRGAVPYAQAVITNVRKFTFGTRFAAGLSASVGVELTETIEAQRSSLRAVRFGATREEVDAFRDGLARTAQAQGTTLLDVYLGGFAPLFALEVMQARANDLDAVVASATALSTSPNNTPLVLTPWYTLIDDIRASLTSDSGPVQTWLNSAATVLGRVISPAESTASIVGELAQKLLALSLPTEAATPEVTRLARQLNQQLTTLRDQLSRDAALVAQSAVEVPPIFSWSNADVVDVTTVDAALRDVVQPANVEGTYAYYADSATNLVRGQLPGLQALNQDFLRDAAVFYDSFLRVARKLFPFSGSETGTVYQQAQTRGNVHEAINRLQERKTVTLGAFCRINQVQLKLVRVDGANGIGEFYQMTAKLQGGDDTFSGFFSKFGPRRQVADQLEASIEAQRELARRSANTQTELGRLWRMLSEDGRQEVLLAYARQHCTIRSYGGAQ